MVNLNMNPWKSSFFEILRFFEKRFCNKLLCIFATSYALTHTTMGVGHLFRDADTRLSN